MDGLFDPWNLFQNGWESLANMSFLKEKSA